MALTQDQFDAMFGGSIKRIATMEDLAEEEEKRRQEQALADAQKAAAEDAAKKEKEDKKGFLQKAGDVIGGVGNFVKDTAVDMYKAGESAVTGIKDVVEGQVVSNKQGKVTEDPNANSKEWNQYLSTLQDADFDRPEVIAKLKAFEDKANEIQGRFNDDDKKQLKESQDVNALKTAADAAETFLNVATLGTGTIVKQGIKQGFKMGAKAIAKATARGAGEGAVFSGAAGLTDSISEGMDAEQSVENIAKSAAFGGLLGGASAGIGSKLKANKYNKGVDAENALKEADNAAMAKVDEGVDDIAKDLDAAKAADEAQLKLNEERPFNQIDDAELDNQIEMFGRNENRTGDIVADYKRQQQLLDEKAARTMEAERTAFTENGLPNDVAGAQKALDDFDNGDLPDSALRPREANIESTAQIFADESIPIEIRNSAQEVMDDLAQAENVQKTLMNDVKYERSHIDMDNAYRERLAQIQEMPGPRYIQEREKLDMQYQDDLAELELIREKDLPEVQQYNEIIDRLKQREQRIVSDVNTLIKERPDDFRIPDEAEVAARRTELESNLESAKRFNEPAKQVEEISQRADPVAAVNRDAEAQASFKQEASTQVDEMAETVKSNFKNIEGVKLGMLRVMSPSQVLEKWGLRGKDIDLHTDILRAESALNRANKADSEVLSEIARIIPENKVAQSQIIDYLEGNRKTLDLGDQQAADKIRAFLDEKKAGLEAQGYGTIEEYFPHIFNKKDPDVQRLFKAKNNGEISFGNLKSRLENSDDYSRDLMAVLIQYTSGYNRKTILEPALKPLADLPTQVRLAEAEGKWLDGYIDQLMGFDKSNLGQSYNAFMDGVLDKVGLKSQVGKNHYSSHLGGQRMVSAVATMGLNPGTAIRNVTQMINTVADIGPRYSTIGTIDGLRALRAGPKSVEWAELQRVGIMEGGVVQNYFDAITNPGVRGRLSKGRDNAVKGMMSMIHSTDVMLRTQAYYGAKALALKKGLTGKAAEDFAARKVVDTQFITSRVDMPLAFNGQGVRSLTQLATFSGKQAGFLKREIGNVFVKGKDGRYTIDPKHAGNIIAAVGTAWATAELLKPVMGFRETEFIPFYDQIAPMFAAITGEEVEGGDSLYRSPLVRLLAGDGKSKQGLIQSIQSGDMQGFWDDNWSQIIPAGTQIKKTTEGLETTLSGESRNSSGKIRYLQDMDPSSVGQATIFGQYSTEAGREWIKNGFPTLSDKQTQKVDLAADRKAKEQLTDFYQASKNIDFKNSEGKKGHTNAIDDIKNAILQGNVNKAQRIANEYNEAVSKAMQTYYSKQDEMPQELQDIVNNRMYINVQKVMSNMEDD